MTNGVIRAARPDDLPEIVALIADLADYEHELAQAVATAEQLHSALFTGERNPSGTPAIWCNVVEHEGNDSRLGGIALWFLNFSTWTGEHGIHLEDLYVRPELRGLGYGQRLLGSVAQVCVEQGYPRLEWSVLDWNEPSIKFYESLGAHPLTEWVGYRLVGDALSACGRI